jgi:hypothetical protein
VSAAFLKREALIEGFTDDNSADREAIFSVLTSLAVAGLKHVPNSNIKSAVANIRIRFPQSKSTKENLFEKSCESNQCDYMPTPTPIHAESFRV